MECVRIDGMDKFETCPPMSRREHARCRATARIRKYPVYPTSSSLYISN